MMDTGGSESCVVVVDDNCWFCCFLLLDVDVDFCTDDLLLLLLDGTFDDLLLLLLYLQEVVDGGVFSES